MAIEPSAVYQIIAEVLGVPESRITDDLGVGDIREWDSLGHMRIIAALESKLGVALDVDQVIEIEDVQDILDVVCQPDS